MAALSSAESPPSVFNGDTMEDRDPAERQDRDRGDRDRGELDQDLERGGPDEPGAGTPDATCSVGIPECPQDEEVSARLRRNEEGGKPGG